VGKWENTRLNIESAVTESRRFRIHEIG